MSGEAAEGGMRFEIFKAAVGDGSAARLGRLTFSGRKVIETPNFIATTIRGAVPHLTPDVVKKHTQFGGAYFALEDCESVRLLYAAYASCS
jgi:queuine tRNA-ribosyltransferase accessory subunit